MATHTSNANVSQSAATTRSVVSSSLGVLSAVRVSLPSLQQLHTGADHRNRSHQCQTIADLQRTAAFSSLVRPFFWLEQARALCTSIHLLSLA